MLPRADFGGEKRQTRDEVYPCSVFRLWRLRFRVTGLAALSPFLEQVQDLLAMILRPMKKQSHGDLPGLMLYISINCARSDWDVLLSLSDDSIPLPLASEPASAFEDA